MLRVPWLLGVILLVLAGCSGGGGDGAARRTSRLALRVITADQPSSGSLRRAESSSQTRVAPGSPGFVTRLDTRVEATDIASPITRSLTLTEAQQSEVTVDLLVPVGTQRHILVTAFNTSGAKIFEGETTVDLTRDLEVVPLTLVRVLLLEAADAADLANKTFVFADGVALGVTGAVTLTVGTFTGNTGPFTLTSGSCTASGTVTIVPATTSSAQSRATSSPRCDFLVATSTYPPDQGPQAGEHSPVFCQVDAVDGRLIVADIETGARSTSTPPVVSVGGTFPFILDFSRLDDASQRLQ